jgi:hypothetical protein
MWIPVVYLPRRSGHGLTRYEDKREKGGVASTRLRSHDMDACVLHRSESFAATYRAERLPMFRGQSTVEDRSGKPPISGCAVDDAL